MLVRSHLLLEQGSGFAVVIALHVLQVGLVTPLLRAYLQSSRVGCFVWSVFSGVWFSLDYRGRKEIEMCSGKKGRGEDWGVLARGRG